MPDDVIDRARVSEVLDMIERSAKHGIFKQLKSKAWRRGQVAGIQEAREMLGLAAASRGTEEQ